MIIHYSHRNPYKYNLCRQNPVSLRWIVRVLSVSIFWVGYDDVGRNDQITNMAGTIVIYFLEGFRCFLISGGW